LKIAGQHPEREGKSDRSVGEDESKMAIDQSNVRHQDVKGDQNQNVRKKLRHQRQHHEHVLSSEVESAQRIGA
jgi:hypothetical protein